MSETEANCKHEWTFNIKGKVGEKSKLFAKCKKCEKEIEYKEGISTNE